MGDPHDLNGVDISDGCPHCGAGWDLFDGFLERPAGYYSCASCWGRWVGDPDNAELETDPREVSA